MLKIGSEDGSVRPSASVRVIAPTPIETTVSYSGPDGGSASWTYSQTVDYANGKYTLSGASADNSFAVAYGGSTYVVDGTLTQTLVYAVSASGYDIGFTTSGTLSVAKNCSSPVSFAIDLTNTMTFDTTTNVLSITSSGTIGGQSVSETATYIAQGS